MEATKEFRQKWRVLRNAIRVPDKNAKTHTSKAATAHGKTLRKHCETLMLTVTS